MSSLPRVTTSVPTRLTEVTIHRRRQARECLAGCLMLSWVISAHLFQCSDSERPRRTCQSPVTSLSGPVCPHSKVRGLEQSQGSADRGCLPNPPSRTLPLGPQSLNTAAPWVVCPFVPDTPSTPPVRGGEHPALALMAVPWPAAVSPLPHSRGVLWTGQVSCG